ncbi:dimethyladenosine transferase [Synechococcus sp. PCC 7335]|uniref:16S rRNA (adenine(1518)-N(6)/adenine(1519)-N(6))- dimethyltransferase RsmA n=1 Tax=Synechococcus sp. (strain ATCC 29403 / PCC 7335) TaxID=91464 RepID=UPI00017EE067|nr:16S rRNA (adenine(1518)-N(6)/adenine(1519)-N(6))-dimethyltransferase RsmA [Synechococcus sp. PCC 7335]EDX85135.1 dimethyladenosine transferase [Synechococcus sp. PCC 7335]
MPARTGRKTSANPAPRNDPRAGPKVGKRARKRFGQHWLCSDQVLNQIVRAGELAEGDLVLEIGPGQGVLTQRLLDTSAKVLAVEIDRDLCLQLSDQFIADMASGQFRLIESDFLELNFDQALLDFELDRPNKVVANIPYYITAPILEKLLGTMRSPNPFPFSNIVLLVQKEISDRLCAQPGTRANGALTIRVQYLAECEEICLVPPSAFKPTPKVDSAVVRLRPRPFLTPAEDPIFLSQLVKLGFSQKRKMLRNNLQSIVDRDTLSALLESLSLNPQTRAEGLGVGEWVALSNAVGKLKSEV